MKKLFTILLLSLFITICCCACTPTTTANPTLDNSSPWIFSEFLHEKSERSEYKVTKYYVYGETDIPVTDESSHLTYTITYDKESNLYTLTTDFTIKYTNSEYLSGNYESYRGNTDHIQSKTVFRTDSLTAVYTEKNVELESAPEYSYSYTVNYTDCTASFKYTNTNETKELSFAKGNYIDNEYLYYYIRNMKNMGTSLSETFYIVNWYDCFSINKFFTTQMTARYIDTKNVVTDNEQLSDCFTQKTDEKGKGTINVHLISVSLYNDDLKTGKPLYVSYSTSPFVKNKDGIDSSSSKVIVEMYNYEYTRSGSDIFKTDYILTDLVRE